MDKRTYLAWLQSTQAPQQNEGWKKAIDMAQTAGDVVSFGASFIPGGNLVGSAIDAVSAGVDLAQGDYLDAGLRGTAAGAGLLPGGGAAVKVGAAATKAAKAVATSKAVGGTARAIGGAIAGTKAGEAAIGAGRAIGNVVAATKAGKAAIGAVDAVKAAKAGTSGASAVAKGTEAAAGAAKAGEAAATAAKPSLLGRVTSAARTTGKAISKGAQAVNDYGAERQSNASDTFGKKIGTDKNSKNSQYNMKGRENWIEQQKDFLAPVGADVQSNLVSQGTQATHSRKRDNDMAPAFSYRGAYGMFRPVGYGMNENTLNKMVNNHVNKFLKSKKGKELKSEVKNIAKKRVD
jgi:hypothetical protein